MTAEESFSYFLNPNAHLPHARRRTRPGKVTVHRAGCNAFPEPPIDLVDTDAVIRELHLFLGYAQHFHSADRSPKLYCQESFKLCTACSPLGEATHQANFVLWQIRGKYPQDSPEQIAAIEQQFRELSGQVTHDTAVPNADSPSGPSLRACALVGTGGKILILSAPDSDHWTFPSFGVEHGRPVQQCLTDMVRERFDARTTWIEFATAVEYVEWQPKSNTHEHTILLAFDIDTDRSPDEITKTIEASGNIVRWVPPNFLSAYVQPRRLRDHLVGRVAPANPWRPWPLHRPY